MKEIGSYSPFSITDMLSLFEDYYPIENEVILDKVFNGDKKFFDTTIGELRDLGFITNGMSYNYHWLTDLGKKQLD